MVLPAAKSGLTAAVLLGVGRGFGETMAVLMASGHAINLPTSVFDSVRAMTATIAAELGETAVGSEHYRALFTIGILLFLVTFLINLGADIMVRGGKAGAKEGEGLLMFEATELNQRNAPHREAGQGGPPPDDDRAPDPSRRRDPRHADRTRAARCSPTTSCSPSPPTA